MTPPPFNAASCIATQASTASTAPLRIEAPSKSMPDNRVCAENGMKCAPIGAISRPRMAYFSFASTTMERPSGVSSGSDDNLRRVREFLAG